MTTRNDPNRHPMNQDMPADMDYLLLLYLDALDRQDWEAFGSIWKQAENDAELERALRDVHRGIIEEHNAGGGWDEDAEAVHELAVLHFPERPPAEGTDDLERPLTAGDVAGRLAADLASGAVRMTDADREANARLQGDPTPLPSETTRDELARWGRNLGVEANDTYWRLFRKVTVRLTMARSQAHTRLAAAREQSPRPAPPPPKKDENDS